MVGLICWYSFNYVRWSMELIRLVGVFDSIGDFVG